MYAPYDVALPTVLGYRREGRAEWSGTGITVLRLNDQHAYLSHLDVLHVGDIVRCGVAHPCTAFDRWPLVAVLDDNDRVIDAVTTMF
jgi:D-serine dehydratase